MLDMIFCRFNKWILCFLNVIVGAMLGLVLFLLMLTKNGGDIKGFYVGASLFGMAIYVIVFSSSIRKVMSKLWCKMRILKKN